MTTPAFGDSWIDLGRPKQTAVLVIHPEQNMEVLTRLLSTPLTKDDVILRGVTVNEPPDLAPFWNGDSITVTVTFEGISSP